MGGLFADRASGAIALGASGYAIVHVSRYDESTTVGLVTIGAMLGLDL